MGYKHNTWKTKWGKNLIGVYRDGKTDWNTNQAILAEDEYFFHKLPFQKTGTAIDIGGFVGSAALALASLGVKTVVVEALSDNVKCINDAVRLNSFEDKIKVYHRAIGKTDEGVLTVYLGNVNDPSGNAHEFIGNAFAAPGVGVQAEHIPTISLDTIFKENNIDHCPILKIDCEGGEWECFESASLETLKKIDYIVGELHCHVGGVSKTRQDFLDLLQGQFEDISESFALSLGIQGAQGLSNFVLKRKT